MLLLLLFHLKRLGRIPSSVFDRVERCVSSLWDVPRSSFVQTASKEGQRRDQLVVRLCFIVAQAAHGFLRRLIRSSQRRIAEATEVSRF